VSFSFAGKRVTLKTDMVSRTAPALLTAAGLMAVILGCGHSSTHFTLPGASQWREASSALRDSRQMVLVVTTDWDQLNGQMRRYQRGSSREAWQQVGPAIAVVVGRNGLAWGRGLHGEAPALGPVKKEGDGRGPAGLFALSRAFGYDEAPAGLKLPYIRALATTECVDDSKSAHYNSVLDRSRIAHPDWISSEQMRRSDELYRWGVVVDHNAGKPVSGGGSCIFLHIWSGANQGTAGCTAMAPVPIRELLLWLDSAANPVLVQLPETEYKRLQDPWQLPD
jgi:L,D-peptidoglycan transpeptidase YkuD (ErfK/YbiS/YcfS/YnhG family)